MNEVPQGRTVIAWRDWHVAVVERYKESWVDRHFRFSAPIALILFLGSLGVNVLATQYATEKASNPVTDIILSNIPTFDVDWFFVYGLILMVLYITALCLWYPKRIPFLLHSLTLFILIRAAFVSMTHLAPFSDYASPDFGETVNKLFFGGDLFFSGHTGVPFLLALMFWHNPNQRAIFLGLSVFFGAIVLMGHHHYTIDVASAFFITYGIYHVALWLFPKERALFLADSKSEGLQ